MTKEIRRVSESLSSPELHHGSIGSAAAPAAVRRAPRRTLHPRGQTIRRGASREKANSEGADGSARGGRGPPFQLKMLRRQMGPKPVKIKNSAPRRRADQQTRWRLPGDPKS